MSVLFTPFTLKDITLRNRIAVPPMCQYSATEGLTNDWHQVHYAGLARGGAGLVIVEATAVSPEGRITPHCLGLWNDAQAEGLARIAAAIKAAGAVPGIQIAHAGRKASANRPWDGDDHLPTDDPRAWETWGPSAIAFGGALPRVPKAMTFDEIDRVTGSFASAARRARDAGFEWLELHFAHGYLAQSFFSPHSNHRDDRYGGNLENRCRFLLETLAAVRDVWPEHLPLTARFGVIEFDGNDERTLAESIEGVRRMRAAGLDLLNVSINFVIPDTHIPWEKSALLAPIAEKVSRGAGVSVAVGWGVDEPALAERVVAEKQVDLVMMGRAMLANPHYPYVLAQALNVDRPEDVLPAPYAHWLKTYHGAGKLSS